MYSRHEHSEISVDKTLRSELICNHYNMKKLNLKARAQKKNQTSANNVQICANVSNLLYGANDNLRQWIY